VGGCLDEGLGSEGEALLDVSQGAVQDRPEGVHRLPPPTHLLLHHLRHAFKVQCCYLQCQRDLTHSPSQWQLTQLVWLLLSSNHVFADSRTSCKSQSRLLPCKPTATMIDQPILVIMHVPAVLRECTSQQVVMHLGRLSCMQKCITIQSILFDTEQASERVLLTLSNICFAREL